MNVVITYSGTRVTYSRNGYQFEIEKKITKSRGHLAVISNYSNPVTIDQFRSAHRRIVDLEGIDLLIDTLFEFLTTRSEDLRSMLDGRTHDQALALLETK